MNEQILPGQRVWLEAGGDQDVEPRRPGQAVDGGGRKQGIVVHVVEHQQASCRLLFVASVAAAPLQLADDPGRRGVEILLVQLKREGRRQVHERLPQIRFALAS